MEALKANEQYSMFVDLIESANLTSLLENENGSMTVLVPKNDVFTEVKEYFDELGNDSDSKKLENLVKSHIIDGNIIYSLSKKKYVMNSTMILIYSFIFRCTLLCWYRFI